MIHTKMFLTRRDYFVQRLGLLSSAYEEYNEGVEAPCRAEYLYKSFPKWTNYTETYKQTLDHIWFNLDKIRCDAVLEIPDEKYLN